MSRLTAFLRDERGATVIEYAMIAAVGFLAILSSVIYFGDNLSNTFTVVGSVWTSG